MTKSQNKGLIAGLVISGLSLVASAIVIPEVRVFLGIEEPHKVKTPSGKTAIFETESKVKSPIKVDNLIRWTPNGRLGIPVEFVVVNVGSATSRNSATRVTSSSELLHEDVGESHENHAGYVNDLISKQFDGILPNEKRRIAFTYWLHSSINAVKPGNYPITLVVFSGADGESKSNITLEFTIPENPKIEDKG